MNSTGPSRRKLAYLSGTRADFGLLRSTLQRAALTLDVSVLVTGTHLSASFGHTVDEIRSAGLRVAAELPIDVTTRSPETMAAAIGECLMQVTSALARDMPDLLLLLGDRGEMLAGAIAALHLGLPTVHLHGGERSGTVDEPVRHAISKLASYHFVATEGARERLLRMGEAADRVFVTGAPGLDGLAELANLSRAETCAALGLPSDAPFALVLFHPVVQQAGEAARQTAALAQALSATGLPVAWLAPNADAGSLDVLRALDAAGLPPGSVRLRHLQRPLFCAAMRHAAVLAGNSSAGIIEAASFGTPVVNIGDRQRDRERNPNVADVPPDAGAIERALAAGIARGRWPCDNLYGDGRAGERIVRLLESLPLHRGLLEKTNSY